MSSRSQCKETAIGMSHYTLSIDTIDVINVHIKIKTVKKAKTHVKKVFLNVCKRSIKTVQKICDQSKYYFRTMSRV